ncbi:hypothetical protein KDN24_05250 [Bacillus sp. Bva_UNVM-123]|uniref:hypothetical protein n=1 Tax=Bacillus sp. Bva_UNVM-123 TaxID=2829798 RepID=UPI00391FA674
MNKILVLIMAIICVTVLAYGQQHWKQKNIAASIEGKAITEKMRKKEQAKKEALIESLDPKKNKSQSLIDYLQYKAVTEDKSIVAVFGSDMTAAASASHNGAKWIELLRKSIQSENEHLASLVFVNHGFPGYSTADLLAGKKMDLLIETYPNLVLFENPIFNNFSQSITIEQTLKDMETIMSKLNKELPNSKIIIMNPNPIINPQNENSVGQKYLDYISESEQFITENKWFYINNIKEFEKKLKRNNGLLVDILAHDYVQLNDNGNVFLYEIVIEYLSKKIIMD